MHPARFEFSGIVIRQRDILFKPRQGRQAGWGIQRPGQNAGPDQNLKTVADPDYKFPRGDKLGDILSQPQPQFIGQNPAGNNVIAVSKPAGDRHNMIIRKLDLSRQKPVDVHQIHARAALLKGEHRFHIAIGAGSA